MIREGLSLFGFVKMADGDRVNLILLTKKLLKKNDVQFTGFISDETSSD